MNRQERRKREREAEKDINILRKLPEREVIKINQIINKVAESKSEEALNLIDRSFSAVLVSEGWTFKEVKRIQDLMAEFMIEDQEKIRLLEKEKVDMDKLQAEVREFMEGLIKSGKGRKEVVEEAKKIAKEVTKNLEKEIEKEDHIAEVGQKVEDSKEEVREEKAMSKLKIKKVELEGEFGSYIREGNKVIAGEITFNSLEELEEYQRKEIELFNRRMEEIREVYKVG